jgi:hypothetical protein
MFLHSNSISEQRSSGKWRTRIDRQYPDSLSARPQRPHERRCSGRLTDSRRTCQPDDMRSSRIRRELLHDHRQRRRSILDPADQSTEGTRIPCSDSGDDVMYFAISTHVP